MDTSSFLLFKAQVLVYAAESSLNVNVKLIIVVAVLTSLKKQTDTDVW